MKTIKKGDLVVSIMQLNTSVNGHIFTWMSEDGCNGACLAPNPNRRYEVGDWVLPVASSIADSKFDMDHILVPQKVSLAAKHGYSTEGGGNYLLNQLVPITREGDRIIIGESCALSIEEYRERYKVDDLPPDTKKVDEPHDSTPPKIIDEIGDAPKSTNNIPVYKGKRPGVWSTPTVDTWPTPKDVAECCGVWGHPDWKGRLRRVSPANLPKNHESRNDFDAYNAKYDFIRIEPIPPQCIQREPDMVEDTWTTEAVKRYPRLTEWD